MKEIRNIPTPKFEVRQSKTSSGLTAYGYTSVWDSLSLDLGGFRERVQRGAWADSLQNDEQMVYFGHDCNNILGSTEANTATMKEDSKGLLVSCELPNTQLGNDVATLLERGDLKHMSVGFGVSDKGQTWANIGGEIVRTITKATLYEASFVAQPAFPDTTAAVRSLAAFKASKRSQCDLCEMCTQALCSACSDDDSTNYDELCDTCRGALCTRCRRVNSPSGKDRSATPLSAEAHNLARVSLILRRLRY